jgi:hypothetical protein
VVNGDANDALASLDLEVVQNGHVVSSGGLLDTSSTEHADVFRPFGPSGAIEIYGGLFPIDPTSINQNSTVKLQLRARTANGLEAIGSYVPAVTVLGRYDRNARCGTTRDEEWGGDDWARREILSYITDKFAGVTYNDFSNLHGGGFPPHASHRRGQSIDAKFATPNYVKRDEAVFHKLLDLALEDTESRIKEFYVTYCTPARRAESAPGTTPLQKYWKKVCAQRNPDPFWEAIKDIASPNGSVDLGGGTSIRSVKDHEDHFHIEFKNLPW